MNHYDYEHENYISQIIVSHPIWLTLMRHRLTRNIFSTFYYEKKKLLECEDAK